MDVFFIRHGQTVLNQSNTHQYSSTPLSEKGLREADALAQRLQEVHIDSIYSSPLLRAKQTAEAIAKHSGKTVLFLEELREIKRPTEIEGKNHDDPIVKKIKQGIKDHYAEKDWHHSDEENFWDIKERTSCLMKRLENEQDDAVLLVSHGVAIKMFLFLCIFKEKFTPEAFVSFYENIHIFNTGITHCQHTKEQGWKIIQINDTTHLKEQ